MVEESMFGGYPPINETEPINNDAASQPKKKKLKKFSKKKKLKILKQVAKQLKKSNKLQKERQKQEERKKQEDERQKQEDAVKTARCKNFLTKLGDAVCKAVPIIFKAFATAIIGCLFNKKPYIKNFQAG